MKILKTIFLFALVGFFTQSCVESEDLVTADAVDVGVVTDQAEASGKVLGLPNPDSTVTFLDVALNFRMEQYSGDASRIASYRVVKSFSGENGSGSVDVATFNELPFDINYASIEDFLEGIAGVEPDDLRIGDAFNFTTYVTTTDGNEYQFAPNLGSLTVPVNCLSDLAGEYTVVGSSPDRGVFDATYQAEIIELSPGEYYFIPMGAWITTVRTDIADIAAVFSDVCGELEIPAQNLGGDLGTDISPQFTNEVVGFGSVDIETGVLSFEYTISGLGNNIDTFTPNE